MKVQLGAIAESVSEATVKSFEKNIGDYVEVDDIVMTFETAKNDAQVRTTEAGVIKEFLVGEGDDVEIGVDIFVIDTEGKKGASSPPSDAPKEENKATETSAPEQNKATETKTEAPPAPEKKAPKPPVTPAKPPPAPKAPSSGMAGRTERREKMTRLRRTVAANLKGSLNTNASVTTFQEIDMKAVMDIRKELGEEYLKRHGQKLGFMSFFIKACARAMVERPVVNAVIDNEKNEIVFKDYVDISIAMSAPRGLVTPVMRNIQNMSFYDCESTMAEMAAKARGNALAIEDMVGGSFTISNGGVFGSMNSAPIINTGQASIMGMHNIVNRPVVRNGQIVARPIMYVSLTYDHRLLDGREGAGFLKRVADFIDDPRRLLLEY